MKKITLATIAALMLAGVVICLAQEMQEMPKFPEPVMEHAWLQKFVGEWETDVEMMMEPGKPPIKSKGTETVRSIGGFWIVGESKGQSPMDGKPFTGILTLGYDPEDQEYLGTWIDSMTSQLWVYEGEVDPSGKILTLETEGPCPMAPGKISKFKEVVEFKSDDHRIFTSSFEDEGGNWITPMTVTYHRKK